MSFLMKSASSTPATWLLVVEVCVAPPPPPEVLPLCGADADMGTPPRELSRVFDSLPPKEQDDPELSARSRFSSIRRFISLRAMLLSADCTSPQPFSGLRLAETSPVSDPQPASSVRPSPIVVPSEATRMCSSHRLMDRPIRTVKCMLRASQWALQLPGTTVPWLSLLMGLRRAPQ